jgi:hypothetical protein
VSTPRVTGETVERAIAAFDSVPARQGAVDDAEGQYRDAMRAALEAVLPDLGDILQALTEVYESGAMGGEWPTLGADAVMDLITGTES